MFLAMNILHLKIKKKIYKIVSFLKFPTQHVAVSSLLWKHLRDKTDIRCKKA